MSSNYSQLFYVCAEILIDSSVAICFDLDFGSSFLGLISYE